ncbi:MAG: acetyltransferase [Methanocorpusculum sp.]|uniref:acetyltransferase n=1 Tax=Methanocorpusculum sp. TaxID=2058474 RepID=UPI002727D24D|nr:acetyltransferase [Methanocorpusculum sp.]MDO9523807.1 acetyltransferase [Methanocorpusculum sp.]
MGKKLVLVGGGGHCKSILSSIDINVYSDIVIIDSPGKVGDTVDGVLIGGTDDDLQKFYNNGYSNAFIAVGTTSCSTKRQSIYKSLKKIGFSFPSIIDSSAVIAKSAIIEEGVFVGKNAVVNAGAQIGRFSIINTGALVDHDCSIGSFVHLSPGVILSGAVTVGNNTHIGTGSCVKQCVTIGESTTIGMGSVVLGNLPSNCTAFGVPCKVREES